MFDLCQPVFTAQACKARASPFVAHRSLSCRDNMRYCRRIQCAAVKRSYKNFDDMLVNSPGPLLVDFYATWCGPCLLMADVLEVRPGTS